MNFRFRKFIDSDNHLLYIFYFRIEWPSWLFVTVDTIPFEAVKRVSIHGKYENLIRRSLNQLLSEPNPYQNL